VKKILFIYCCFIGVASFAATDKKKKKTVKRNLNRTSKTYTQTYDSARYYYLKAWDYYKLSDLGPARYFWERGANCNTNTPARYSCAFRLGLMHQNGEGMGINQDIAFYYYNLAYANGKSVGNTDATKVIAAYYENGLVFVQDFNKALLWYERAKKQGNQYCDEDISRTKKKIEQYYAQN
jgi:TPR repeat protein